MQLKATTSVMTMALVFLHLQFAPRGARLTKECTMINDYQSVQVPINW